MITTDAAAYFEAALLDARQAAARAYSLAEVTRRLWAAAVAAQGDAGEPVSVEDVLEDARRRGGEEGRAEVLALMTRYVDLTTERGPDMEDDR